MATAITTTSTTLEGQFLEISLALKLKQQENPDSAQVITNLNLDHDTSTGQIQAEFSFTDQIGSSGEVLSVMNEIYDLPKEAE
ncbi:MAG: hypothetical protein F6K17_06695 [Okeania sp. SIO3C4]|nr:hypothetical protein [Okeania sp. SIO3C4]